MKQAVPTGGTFYSTVSLRCSLTLSVDYSLTLLLRMIGRVPFYLYVVTDKKSVTYLSHYPSHL